jgi:uncharacterized protein (TIGR02594 family)
MKTAEDYLGVKEISGKKHNPVVVAFFAKSGHPEIKDDETAWCSAFVNAVMFDNGYAGTKNLMARSWLKWSGGTTVSTPRFGDIVIFERGKAPFGHVAFFEKWDNNWVYVLGGNQSNAVTRTRVARSKLLGIRRPKEKTPASPPPKVPQMTQVEPEKITKEEAALSAGGAAATLYPLLTGNALFAVALALTFAVIVGYIVWNRRR